MDDERFGTKQEVDRWYSSAVQGVRKSADFQNLQPAIRALENLHKLRLSAYHELEISEIPVEEGICLRASDYISVT